MTDPIPSHPLFKAAAFERDERYRVYPDAIRKGLITRDVAQADCNAWVAITDTLAAGIDDGSLRSWFDTSPRELLLALDRARVNRAKAIERAPDAEARAALMARQENVAAIDKIFRARTRFCVNVTEALQARAHHQPERMAA